MNFNSFEDIIFDGDSEVFFGDRRVWGDFDWFELVMYGVRFLWYVRIEGRGGVYIVLVVSFVISYD